MSRLARWHVRRGHSFVVRSQNGSVRCPIPREKRDIDVRNSSPTHQTSDLARSVKKEEKEGRVQKFVSLHRPKDVTTGRSSRCPPAGRCNKLRTQIKTGVVSQLPRKKKCWTTVFALDCCSHQTTTSAVRVEDYVSLLFFNKKNEGKTGTETGTGRDPRNFIFRPVDSVLF